MAYDAVIGDSQPKAVNAIVSCFPVSVVTAADLAEQDAPINNALVSGKAKGAMILVNTSGALWVLYAANGPAKTDSWAPVDGGAVVTPA